MPRQTPLFTPVLHRRLVIIVASFGDPASFGVFQIPIADEFGWLRDRVSLAIAIQNLAWGIGQPIFGAIAERFGDRRAIVLGALIYVLGLVLSAFAVTPRRTRPLERLSGSASPAPGSA
jgi:MFS family permease